MDCRFFKGSIIICSIFSFWVRKSQFDCIRARLILFPLKPPFACLVITGVWVTKYIKAARCGIEPSDRHETDNSSDYNND
jgi:CHASE2 domain-containing sensor protein